MIPYTLNLYPFFLSQIYHLLIHQHFLLFVFSSHLLIYPDHSHIGLLVSDFILLKRLELLKEVEVLIDGKFELDKRDIMLKYRGSDNQRVIDVKKSLEQGIIVEIL